MLNSLKRKRTLLAVSSRVTLSGVSVVSKNVTVSSRDGAGISVLGGTLTMNEYSGVKDNTANFSNGGGIHIQNSEDSDGDEANVTLNDYSSVTGNFAWKGRGGGVNHVNGNYRVTGKAKVTNNRPNDYYSWQ